MIAEDITLRNKILTGLSLSYNRLLAKKKAENGELYFYQDGQVIEVKASGIKPIEINITLPE